MIKTSIIMTHYAETEERVDIARRCILAVQPHRNKTTEFILIFDGIFPYRDEFIKYADQWHERPNDASPGRSWNIGARMAKGNILCFICDDNLLDEGAVAQCVRLVKKYPQYIVTPLPPHPGREGDVYSLVDGYSGNTRGGDQCIFMTRQIFEDIGPRDEVDPFTDGINYVNRRIAKGYHVLMTKKPMAKDMAFGRHSFINQMQRLGYRGYKKTKPLYSREKLLKFTYRDRPAKITDKESH